ncbi:MAG: acyl-CoA synthetase (AMP-forming)/AMP-acid ligase II, partial [Alphaproteobacteria bacterium]
MTDTALNDATVLGWLARNARDEPNKLAIRSLDQNKDITHGELFSIANRICRYYEAHGIGRNDRIALLSNNSIEHLAVYLASLAYGCTICTIHVEMNASYFEDILKSINAKIVMCEANQPALERLAGNVPGDWQ